MDFDLSKDTIIPDLTNVLTVTGSGAIALPVGLTSQRPTPPLAGLLRYNTNDDRLEVFQANRWTNFTDALYLAGSTYKTIQDFIDIIGSRGIFSGGVFTDNGNGTISVTGGTGMVHAIDSTLSSLYFFDYPTTASVTLTDNALNNIFVDYNGGSPQIISIPGPDFSANRVIIGQVYRAGTNLTLNNFTRLKLDNSFVGIINRFQTVDPFQHESGAILSGTGTRNIAVSAGVFWEGIDRIASVAKNTAASDTFTYWYRNTPTTWVSVPGQTQINNTQYNNPNTGLASLSNKAYGTHWVYLSSDGKLSVVYGITNTNLVASQDSQPPPTMPNTLLTAALIGRIIILDNATTFTEVTSAFNISFTGGAVTPHNELGGIQGGTADEYYHLTAAEDALVADLAAAGNGLVAKTSAGTFANRTITAGAGVSVTNGNGVLGNPVISLNSDPVIAGTGALTLPSGTTAQRPVPGVNGMIRYNTTLGANEIFDTAWTQVSGVLDKSTANVTQTGTTAANILSYSVPAGILNTTGIIRVIMSGTWVNTGGGNRTMTFTVSYGGTNMYVGVTGNLGSGLNTTWTMTLYLAADNSVTAQSLNGLISISAPGTAGVTTGAGSLANSNTTPFVNTTISGTSSVNSATALSLNVSSVSSIVTNNFIRQFYVVEVL